MSQVIALSTLSFTPMAPAPAVQAVRSAASPVMVMESELGATGPLGYWDPLGFATRNPERFSRYRAVELKHGRIAMAATTGYFVQSFLRWPGYLSSSASIKFADLPNGIAAFKAIPPAGLIQIMVFIGAMEAFTWRFYEGPWPGKVPAGKLPGDVAGDLWVRYTDPEEKKKKLNIEINNGRAAMMGSLGMLMHDHILGTWVPPGF